MKPYILRDPKTVEPQTAPRRLRAQPGPPPPGPTLFIGLDVHNDAIAVSLSPSDSTEVRRHGILGGQHDGVLKVLKKLPAAHPGVGLKLCSEAGLRVVGPPGAVRGMSHRGAVQGGSPAG